MWEYDDARSVEDRAAQHAAAGAACVYATPTSNRNRQGVDRLGLTRRNTLLKAFGAIAKAAAFRGARPSRLR